MKEPVFFSVVIAVRNGARFIARTLNSVLNQTHRNFEVIIVNDGSTDQTEEIVEKYILQNTRLRLIHNSSGSGPSHARNCGIAQARGSWIAICDADDLWELQKLQVQADFIQSWLGDEPLAALGCSGYIINEKDKVIAKLPSFPNTLDEFKRHRESCEPFMMHHASTVFDKNLFWQVGGYRSNYAIGAEDCDLFTRLSDVGVVININQPLFSYRKHLSSSMLKATIEQFNDMERIKENTIRRRAGIEEISYEQFIEKIEHDLTQKQKNIRVRKQKGKFFYRVGAINLANGRYLMGTYNLTLAVLCDRELVFKGIKNSAKVALMKRLEQTAFSGQSTG